MPTNKINKKNVMSNQEKVSEYFDALLNNKEVHKLSLHFRKEVHEVVKQLEKFTVIHYRKSGDIKEIKHDFLETTTGIKVTQSIKY